MRSSVGLDLRVYLRLDLRLDRLGARDFASHGTQRAWQRRVKHFGIRPPARRSQKVGDGDHSRGTGCRALLILVAIGVQTVGVAPAASAQTDFGYAVGAGAGTLYSEDQLGYLGYVGVGGGLTANVGHRVVGPLWLDGRASLLGFASSLPGGSLVELGVGPRLWMRLFSSRVRFGPAVHVHLAQTGQDTRPSVALSLRGGYQLTPDWAVGPELTLSRVFQTSGGPAASSDASFLLATLVVVHTPRSPPKAAAPVSSRPPPRQRARVRVEHPPAPPSPELTMLLDDVVTRRTEQALLSPVLFRFDSTELIACGEASLYQALEIIKRLSPAHASPSRPPKVIIEGHADSVGDEAYNHSLSRRRAAFVHRWLVNHGVPKAQLQIGARGERAPLVADDDPPGGVGDTGSGGESKGDRGARLQLNRRVTFRVVDEGAP